MLEPSDSAEALAFAKLAYELSEQFDTPGAAEDVHPGGPLPVHRGHDGAGGSGK